MKLGSIVRIVKVEITDQMKNFISQKLNEYFTEKHVRLKRELEKGTLTMRNIELLGELYYYNELKDYIETNKKLNGVNSFIY